ncbi:hypothetical protein HZH68_000726 [Vespula germanica]|uniref:Uncharacterized protein n=1 Tax=Vespula germanica TaxID=30212 RepID=A0A834NU48_VESGE|nr:hypothetical protein HZH68_000726 [Vespula germanica]
MKNEGNEEEQEEEEEEEEEDEEEDEEEEEDAVRWSPCKETLFKSDGVMPDGYGNPITESNFETDSGEAKIEREPLRALGRSPGTASDKSAAAAKTRFSRVTRRNTWGGGWWEKQRGW